MGDDATNLEVRILNADSCVLYEPFGDEPDVSAYVRGIDSKKSCVVIPQDKNLDARALATQYVDRLGKGSVIVFAPGREFDHEGTRYGRGGGWYDRFFAAVPAWWVRVGVSNMARVSEVSLPRKETDEPIDFLLIFDKGFWSVEKVGTRLS